MKACFSAIVPVLFLLGSASAEQITSTCRVTAVDNAKGTVTLVRKSGSGGKIGQCKLADNVRVELNGKSTPWDAVKLPCEATVVYDAELRAAVAIHLWDNAGKGLPPQAGTPIDYSAASPSALFVLIHTLAGHARDKSVCGVAFSPNGATLASCSMDRTIRGWSIASSQDAAPARILAGPAELGDAYGSSISYTPDARTLVICRSDGKIQLWDASANPPTLRKTLAAFSGAIFDFSVSPDGRLLAAGSIQQDAVRIWDLTQPDVPEIASLGFDDRRFRSVRFSPDSRTVAVGVVGQLCLCDCIGGTLSKKQTYEVVSDRGALGISFSPDGSSIAYGDGRLLRVLSTADFSPVATFDANAGFLRRTAFTPNGRFLLAADADCRLRLWDLRSRSEVADTGRLQGVEMSMAISPDGKSVATCGMGGFVRIWKIPELQ